jgi:hypothetical protein
VDVSVVTATLAAAATEYIMAVHNYRTAIDRFGRPGEFKKILERHQAALVKAIDEAREAVTKAVVAAVP